MRCAADPEYMARLTAHLLAVMPSPEAKRARVNGAAFSAAGHAARWAKHRAGGPERALTGRRISAAKLAHIPSDWRDDYRRLVTRGFGAAEAERIVKDAAATDRQRIIRELSDG